MAWDGGLRSDVTREASEQAPNCLDEHAASLPTMLSTQQAATYWRVKKDKVLSWIHAGALHAIDVRSSTSSRPQYRIPREAVEAFNASRCNIPWQGQRNEERLGQRLKRPSPKFEWFR